MDLLLGQKRYESEKFMKVWCNFEPQWLHRAHAQELAIVLATPGFAYEHHCWAFAWDMETRLRQVPKLVEYWQGHEETQALAQANAASISEEDGWDYLCALIETKRGYGGSVPFWCTMALQARRARGASALEIAKALKTTSDRVKRWWREESFDPLVATS
jgi:hypothetical protein